MTPRARPTSIMSCPCFPRPSGEPTPPPRPRPRPTRPPTPRQRSPLPSAVPCAASAACASSRRFRGRGAASLHENTPPAPAIGVIRPRLRSLNMHARRPQGSASTSPPRPRWNLETVFFATPARRHLGQSPAARLGAASLAFRNRAQRDPPRLKLQMPAEAKPGGSSSTRLFAAAMRGKKP